LAFLVFLAALAEGKVSMARDWKLVALVMSAAFAIGWTGAHLGAWSLASRRRVAIFGVLLLAATSIFPPWVYTFSPEGAATTTKPAGYHLIFYPPAPERPGYIFGVRIDASRLAIQWIILALFMGVAFSLARSQAAPERKVEKVG